MLAFVFIVPFFVMAIGVVMAFLAFDNLLRIEYTDHSEHWRQDGKPIGFFWMPAGTRFFSGLAARNRLFWTWLSDVPSWAESNERAKWLLRRIRVGMILGGVGWLSFLVGLGCFFAAIS
ncbi:MAG TPA: hypothetical protein VNK04_18425 [Gemmataceae bacterium]|nr:hypothetical protein [Gemmataceae bacterium]